MSETVNSWTIKSVLNWTTVKFSELSLPSPRLDAQLLVCGALNLTKVALYSDLERPLTENERASIRALVVRRIQGEPIAYILKSKFWHNFELYVDNRVLIPRPETEVMLDSVLQVASNYTPTVIWDLCTGSGCLAVGLAKQYESAKVIAVDLSSEALEVAKINSEKYLCNNIIFEQGNVLAKEFLTNLVNKYGVPQIVVSNPPYVTHDEWLKCDKDVKEYEPKMALVAAMGGLEFSIFLTSYFNVELTIKGCRLLMMELMNGGPALTAKHLNVNYVSTGYSLVNAQKNVFLGIKDLEGRERFLGYMAE